MAEETQATPQPRHADDHAGAMNNPEQHLMEAHKLSIQLQGKEGSWGHGVWALVREDRGKTKTLATFKGTRREAAIHFFNFIHPNRTAAAPAPAQRRPRTYNPGPRTGRPEGKPRGRS